MRNNVPIILNSISELHRILALPKPIHPLVSVVNLDEITLVTDEILLTLVYNFYSICIKKGYKGKMKYGQNYYDFDEGMMSFFAPGQVITTEITDDATVSGIWLIVHPDFIRNYPLSKKIKEFGYFSYAVNEALHLSEKEEEMIETLMKNIEKEYQSTIDTYSQDVIISQIELLLNYCNRFYNRQFITRKNASNELLISMENLLDTHFEKETKLPTVQYLSDKLNVSTNYLNDMLKSLTGQTTQQHIHAKLIEKAKEKLTTTSLSVSEIAYELGFEYPQSFNKLFKSKTNFSPLEFRKSFN
ncbi:helix-turn-helix domain-containing protein [Flavobacterium sp. SUN052]|uniref:helix-turn-helix domain-containing protein n=1 Tax=Flavobacterium sp. SUN052 TaxID=3002441 RepID=UPI00237D5991|nr:helix-turn-helix domain-containing protein [Flavobacterium sp. SUN052]MEC4005842.1 helix-turn-helix domain-containing protein [Flavobacterium sp. SUN052]